MLINRIACLKTRMRAFTLTGLCI